MEFLTQGHKTDFILEIKLMCLNEMNLSFQSQIFMSKLFFSLKMTSYPFCLGKRNFLTMACFAKL